jgi:hypothetical protein
MEKKKNFVIFDLINKNLLTFDDNNNLTPNAGFTIGAQSTL